jgi:hypothetical protein
MEPWVIFLIVAGALFVVGAGAYCLWRFVWHQTHRGGGATAGSVVPVSHADGDHTTTNPFVAVLPGGSGHPQGVGFIQGRWVTNAVHLALKPANWTQDDPFVELVCAAYRFDQATQFSLQVHQAMLHVGTDPTAPMRVDGVGGLVLTGPSHLKTAGISAFTLADANNVMVPHEIKHEQSMPAWMCRTVAVSDVVNTLGENLVATQLSLQQSNVTFSARNQETTDGVCNSDDRKNLFSTATAWSTLSNLGFWSVPPAAAFSTFVLTYPENTVLQVKTVV